MKKLLILVLVVSSLQAFADKKYSKLFNDAIQADTLPLAEQILKDWEQNGPHDGDYYAAHFNLHFNKAITSIMMLGTELPVYAQPSFTLSDSVGGVAGYIFQDYMIVDSLQLDSARLWLNKGVELFPQRLDLWIGLAKSHLYANEVDDAVQVLGRLTQWKLANANVKWTWTSDSKIKKQSDPIDEVFQEYFNMMWNFDQYLPQAGEVADMGILLSPKNVVFYNDRAAIEFALGRYEQALDLFRKALKIAPKDKLVKQNIQYVEQQIAKQRYGNSND